MWVSRSIIYLICGASGVVFFLSAGLSYVARTQLRPVPPNVTGDSGLEGDFPTSDVVAPPYFAEESRPLSHGVVGAPGVVSGSSGW